MTGSPAAATEASSVATQSARDGVSQSRWTTRRNRGDSACHRLCQWPGPESPSPGSIRTGLVTKPRRSITGRRLRLFRQRPRQTGEHLLGHDLPEARQLALPVEQELLGEARLRGQRMLSDEIPQHRSPMRRRDALPDHRVGIDDGLEAVVGIVDEGHAAIHAGGEIGADPAENDGDAAGHILATVRAAALDDDLGAGVADGEALARLTGGEELAGR